MGFLTKMIRPSLAVEWGHLTLSTLVILLTITSSAVFWYKTRGSHHWRSTPARLNTDCRAIWMAGEPTSSIPTL